MAIRGTNIFALLEDESDNLLEPEETPIEPVQQEKPAPKNHEARQSVEEAKVKIANPQDRQTKAKDKTTEEVKSSKPKIQEPQSKATPTEETKPSKPKSQDKKQKTKGPDTEEVKSNKPKSQGKSGEDTAAREVQVSELKSQEQAKKAVIAEEPISKSVPWDSQFVDLPVVNTAKPAQPIDISTASAPTVEETESKLWEAPATSVAQPTQVRKTSSIHSEPKDQGEKPRKPTKNLDTKNEERVSEAEMAREAASFKTYQEFLGQVANPSKPKSDPVFGFIRYEDTPEFNTESYRGRGYRGRRTGRRGGRGPAMGRGAYEGSSGRREGNEVAQAKSAVPDVMDQLSFPKLG